MTCSARPGDVYLLCSDGLTTMVKDDRIAELLAGARPPRRGWSGGCRRGQPGRRARQHHRRRLPPRGRRPTSLRPTIRRDARSARAPRRPASPPSDRRPRRSRRAPRRRRHERRRSHRPRRTLAHRRPQGPRRAPRRSSGSASAAYFGRAADLLPRHRRGRPRHPLSRTSLRPAARRRALLRGLFDPGPGIVGAGRPPRLRHQPRAAQSATTPSRCSTTSRPRREPTRRRRPPAARAGTGPEAVGNTGGNQARRQRGNTGGGGSKPGGGTKPSGNGSNDNQNRRTTAIVTTATPTAIR